jgi:DNA-binding CsgD family transcriptional regulator
MADTISGARDGFDQLLHTLTSGLLLVDGAGEVRWMDERTRRRVDGELRKLNLPLRREDARIAVDCVLGVVDLEIDGALQPVAVIQVTGPQEKEQLDIRSIASRLEEIMADPSWLVRPLLERLKAGLQATRSAARTTDLDLLSAREREVLLLICEGHSDAEMSRILQLSQNTVRNHLASLFKKIGVNRRSAAIIWARERAVTRQDLLGRSATRRSSSPPTESH